MEQHWRVEAQTGPTLVSRLGGQHLAPSAGRPERAPHLLDHHWVAVIDGAGDPQDAPVGLGLEGLPQATGLLSQMHIGHLGIGQAKDARRPVRTAVGVSGFELVEVSHAHAATDQSPRR